MDLSQDNLLMDDTILNNILFLNDENKVNEKRLKDAINYSGLSEFIDNPDSGINTNVGEEVLFSVSNSKNCFSETFIQ